MKKEICAEVDAVPFRPATTSATVTTWENLFEEGKLTYEGFKEYWLHKIPTLCKMPPPETALHLFESFSPTSILIDELEEFIYNGKKEVVIEIIRKNESVPVICAKPFKSGEPSYNCRECSTDRTCVLCTECFHKSQHRFHKYKMATSGGGGYCDCGDQEAWKNHVFCETHSAAVRPRQTSELRFPPEVFQKTKTVFSYALQFTYDVINKQYEADQVDGRCPIEERNYLVLLYNDEAHTFDQVINLLVDITKCSMSEGLELASKINKDGRAVVAASDFPTGCRIKSDVERRSSMDGSHGLEVHILSYHVVACQCFALKILNWVQTLLNLSAGFRLALVEALQEPDQSLYTPLLLDRILLQDPVLWKSVRMNWNMLLCSGFLLEYESKKKLAIHFVKNFSLIMQNYLNDEEDHVFSSAALSVQLFTVPSIAHSIIATHSALKVVVDFLLSVSVTERNAQGKLAFDRSLPRHHFDRASYILFDIRYLLCSPPTTWEADLRQGFGSGTSSFWEFLCAVEGMDAVTRQMGSHIEFEPEWETSFNLLTKMSQVFHLLDQWCGSDQEVLEREYLAVLRSIKSIAHPYAYETVKVGAYVAVCVKFDPKQNAVSVHLPLTRFWAKLYLRLADRELSFSSRELDIPDKLSLSEIIEPAARVQAVWSQFRVGMWRKNGHSLASQMFFYHDSKFRAVMYDMDVLLLQIGASLVGSNDFLVNLFYKLGIYNWTPKELADAVLETDSSQKWALLDEFLLLVITLVTERYRVGVGKVSVRDCIKYEIIHLLSLKPLPYSEIMKFLSVEPPLCDEVEEIINDVASFKTAGTTMDRGHYELKDDFLSDLNIFFFHFSKEQSFQTEQTLKAHLAKAGIDSCPPPPLPPFTTPFVGVVNLLQCEVMFHVMKMVFNSWVRVNENSARDGHLHKVLFLIGIALTEQESTNGFNFTNKAMEFQIDALMEEVYQCPRLREHRNLTRWTLQKFAKVARNDSILATISAYDHECETISKRSVISRAEQAKAKIMADMKAMQERFFQQNVHAFDDCTVVANVSPVCDSEVHEEAAERVTCILCQEEEVVTMEGRTMVYAAFVQMSTVHMRHRQSLDVHLSDLKGNFLSMNIGPSPYVSTCGHSMHADCWESWRHEVILRRATGSLASSPSHDTNKNEFLCALCQCISNTVLPILPTPVAEREINAHHSPDFTFIRWLKISLTVLHIIQWRAPTPDVSVGQKESSRYTMADDINECSEASTSKINGIQPLTISLEPGSRSTGLTSENAPNPAGYNMECEGDWVLNIKQYNHEASLRRFEMNSLEVPLDKLTWLHSLSASIHSTATNYCKHRSMIVCRSPSLTWKTLAYTIHSIERNLRNSGKVLSESLTPRELACLENLAKISQLLGVSRYQRIDANQCALKLLNMILRNEFSHGSILDVDCFSVLVALVMAVPNIMDRKDLRVASPSLENFILRLTMILQFAQILMTVELPTTKKSSEDRMSNDTICLSFLVSLVRSHHSFFNTDVLWESLKELMKPFLRCCYILSKARPVRPPNVPQTLVDDSYENLCFFLRVPSSCIELLDDEITQSLFMMWAQHPKVRNSIEGTVNGCFKDFLRINRLVPLPEDYSDLLNMVKSYRCPSSVVDDSQNPTLCLVCGKILCSLSYCCQAELNQQKVRPYDDVSADLTLEEM